MLGRFVKLLQFLGKREHLNPGFSEYLWIVESWEDRGNFVKGNYRNWSRSSLIEEDTPEELIKSQQPCLRVALR